MSPYSLEHQDLVLERSVPLTRSRRTPPILASLGTLAYLIPGPMLTPLGTVLIDAFVVQPTHEIALSSRTDILTDALRFISLSADHPQPNPNPGSTPQLSFTSHFPSTTHEVLGGGALYALVGARMWFSPEDLCTLVDRAPGGSDLPPKLAEQLAELGEEMWAWNEAEGTRMTRARIRYDGDVRT